MNGELDDLERNRREAAAAHARLVAHLASLTDAQAAQPSLLPGWSIGHVLTHLARNADSHVGMLQAANEGRAAAQYPGGLEQRNADIEAGQGRPAAALVADVIESNGRLEAAWSAMTADGWRGEGLKERLEEINSPHVLDVRGRGLLLGLQLDIPAGDVVKAGFAHGLVLVNAGPDVLRLAPPLVITDAELDTVVERLDAILKTW